MLISLDWLKQYVDIKEDIPQLENALTMIGQEVEAIDIQGKHLDNVVIGQITEYGKHPNSDKLTLLKVNVGDEEELQIICGAPNHKLGDKVVVAKIGAVLPGDFKIKKSKIRDVESFGMLCSQVELGIGEDGDGIIILPEDAPIGEEYRKYAGLDDVIFELEITPNRPDCLSHIGIAREVAAYYGRKVKYPSYTLSEVIDSVNNYAKVRVEDKERCKRYMGRVIRNVTVAESPEWLKKRIRAMGLKPINNIVDITNFVMFEYNQPMHAFDLDKLENNTVVVRAAENGEKITTLDGVERELVNGELVIADEVKPIAIAGIIGGQATQIEAETKNVFLEVAYFTPDNIRKSAKKLGIVTDSGYRNERGLDIENLPEVIDRAAALIAEVASGEVLDEVIDKYIEKPQKFEIPLNLTKLNTFIGKKLEFDTVGKILSNLGLGIKTLSQDMLLITPPTYRTDLTRPEDLYEEVIRMYGFENIEAVMPVEDIESGLKDSKISVADNLKEILKEIGLHEVINYTFIPREALDILKIKDKVIEISNPLSEDMVIVRPTLMYSLLANIRDNFNRNQFDLRFFEVSKVFTPAEELANEELRICVAIAGKPERTLWNPKPKAYDFYTMKGYVEKLLEYMGINRYKLERSSNENFHPGRSADIKIGNDVIGTFGEVHPDVLEAMDIKRERAYVADIDLARAEKYIKSAVKYERIVKYPEVTRDLAIVMDKDILVGNMVEDLKRVSPLIEKIEIFDVYEGEKIDADKKSVAISIVLRNKVKTLEEKEINDVVTKVLETISKKYRGEIRQ
ncbi:phenylalanine--tRNA ligase subunit beta [uncultured Fusobacterium sp.]|jgi:phenylalanyl-tRNA synthetase beta chain|uniref:phenylalanine--tRNA ligase subunit beta n=1 Tax=uncultured Fusobacterium sp. TaxID=159267 RepID=UPI0015A6CB37|nr:phenylalanine--tRNA ligase subunit beta [uncultured Fusobacterium sp.]